MFGKERRFKHDKTVRVGISYLIGSVRQDNFNPNGLHDGYNAWLVLNTSEGIRELICATGVVLPAPYIIRRCEKWLGV